MHQQIPCSQFKFLTFVFILVCALALIYVGCQKQNVSQGNSRNKGVRANEPEVIEQSYIHPDHFLAIVLKVNDLRQNDSFSKFPWQDMIRIPGQPENDKVFYVDQIDSMVLLFDGAKLRGPTALVLMMNSENDAQILDTITLLNGKNEELVQRANQWLSGSESYTISDENPKLWIKRDETWGVYIQDSKTICMGPPEALRKMMTQSQASRLAKVVMKKSRLSEAALVIDLTSFESMLASLEQTARSLVGDQADEFAVYQKINLIVGNLDIDGEELLKTKIEMEDEESAGRFASQLMKIVSGLLNADSDQGRGTPTTDQSPIDFTSTALLQGIAGSLTVEDYKIELDGSEIVFELKRPKKTEQLINAVMRDISVYTGYLQRLENAEKVAEGLRAYRNKYGRLPPAGKLNGGDSEKLPDQFNWRIGILPFIGHKDLYERFKFDEAWDSEHNRVLIKQMPGVFSTGDREGHTSWFIVNGDQCAYQQGMPLEPGNIQDRADATLMACELNESMQQPWTAPDGININDQFDFGVVGRSVDRFVFGITCEGELKIVKRDEKVIQAFATANGSEPITRSMTFPIGTGGR